MITGRASWRRVGVIAGEEYRRALETRWLFAFTALFALLTLGLSYFGLAQSRGLTGVVCMPAPEGPLSESGRGEGKPRAEAGGKN